MWNSWRLRPVQYGFNVADGFFDPVYTLDSYELGFRKQQRARHPVLGDARVQTPVDCFHALPQLQMKAFDWSG